MVRDVSPARRVSLAGSSLLILAAGLPAMAENSREHLSNLAAALLTPERSALEPPELKPAIDSCLQVRELRFAQVRSAGPGAEGHAEVRLSASGRTWECVARLDGQGLLSLRRIDPGEQPSTPAAAAAMATPSSASDGFERDSPPMRALAAEYDAAAYVTARAASAPAPSGRLSFNQRDRRATLGRPGSSSSLGFVFAPLDRQDASIKLTGSAEHARRPARSGAFRFMTPTGWLDTQRWDLGVDLSLAQEQFRYQGRRGGSFDTRTPTGGPFGGGGMLLPGASDDRPDGPFAYARRTSKPMTGDSSSHRLDVDLLRRDGARLSAHGAISDRAQDGFSTKSVRPLILPDGLVADDRLRSHVREIGARLDLKPFRFTLAQWAESQANRQGERLQAKAIYGPVSVTVARRTVNRITPGTERWTLREAADGRVDLSLEGARLNMDGEGGPRRLLPSAIWLSGGQARTAYSWLEGAPPDGESTFGAGASWSWENGDTELSFSRGQAVSRGLDLTPSDAEDWSLDFSQTSYGRTWDLSAYAYASSSRDHAPEFGSNETFFGGGLTASLHSERFPVTSFSVAIDRFDAFYEGFLDQSSDRSLDLRLDLDFSRYLPRSREGPVPFLRAGFQSQRVLSRQSQSLRSSEWGHEAYVTFGTPF